ncbi:MAG TPA: hypothetical protein V6C81_27275 [Planktothrix sp.]|jgi:hypothetical protein
MNYAAVSSFNQRTVFDVRRCGIIESGFYAGNVEVHIPLTYPQSHGTPTALPGGSGLAIQGEMKGLIERDYRYSGKRCLLAGFNEVFALREWYNCSETLCVILKPLGIGLGIVGATALAFDRKLPRNKQGLRRKFLLKTHRQIGEIAGVSFNTPHPFVLEVTNGKGREEQTTNVPIDALTINQALAAVGATAKSWTAEGLRGHQGGYCDQCACSYSQEKKWSFHGNGEHRSVWIGALVEPMVREKKAALA